MTAPGWPNVEALPDERDLTCGQFLYRAVSWFDTHGVTVLRVLTDNAMVYRRGHNWRAVCVALGPRQRFTKPGCPWTKGKAERFNRTLLTEFAYAQPSTSDQQRRAALPDWSPTTTLDAPTPPSAADLRSPASPHDRQQRPPSLQLGCAETERQRPQPPTTSTSPPPPGASDSRTSDCRVLRLLGWRLWAIRFAVLDAGLVVFDVLLPLLVVDVLARVDVDVISYIVTALLLVPQIVGVDLIVDLIVVDLIVVDLIVDV
jgi:hypothetical protein